MLYTVTHWINSIPCEEQGFNTIADAFACASKWASQIDNDSTPPKFAFQKRWFSCQRQGIRATEAVTIEKLYSDTRADYIREIEYAKTFGYYTSKKEGF